MSLEEMIAQLNRFTTGWVTYFRISEAANVLRVMDEWTRRRLRCFKIKQWKRRPRTRYREMRALGLNREAAAMFAATRKSWWAISMTPQTATAMPPAYFAKLGLISLQRRYTQLQLV
jgi:RNA-directed DNA polymerase